MTERLTSRCEDCVLINGHALHAATIGELVQMAERLAAYEDTGLTPEECGEYKKFEDEVVASEKTFGRLVELLHADKAGRCVVLPCKVGDTIYTHDRVLGTDHAVHDEICTRKIKGYGGNAMNKVWLIASGNYYDFSVFPSEFGKTVFLTREEAERAMEGRKDGDKTSL